MTHAARVRRATRDDVADPRVASAGTVAGATVPADARVLVRRPTRDDVAAIVALLADDPLGAQREDPSDLTAYVEAFDRIDADPAHELVVLDDDGVVVGTLQLTLLPGLSRKGALRAQVEAVRVAASHRGQRLGEQLLEWAVDEARRSGAVVLQLTSDASRIDVQSDLMWIALVIHIPAASLAAVLGALQLIPRVRADRRRHRLIGRTFLAVGTLAFVVTGRLSSTTTPRLRRRGSMSSTEVSGPDRSVIAVRR